MNTPDRPYRHEFKYLVSDPLRVLLYNRLVNILPLDTHAGPDGGYAIRSLYFDDPANTCYHQNEDGVDPRRKYRIRIYNASDSRITLECKRKERGMTRKTASPLTKSQALSLIGGVPPPLVRPGREQATLVEFLAVMMQRSMRPVTIVEYRRTAFVHPAGNVRVTFDTDIVASRDFGNFFAPSPLVRPVLPPGTHLIEIKFDQYLPDFIYSLLQTGQLQQTAFSKFYLSRKINI